MSSSLPALSSQSSSVRGVISSRTGRSARRMMPDRIARSCSSITPVRVASAKIIRSSSAVSPCSPLWRMPIARMMALEEVSSSQTKGAATRASSAIGRAIRMAIGSAARKASCLGTSSPTTSERKVVMAITTTNPRSSASSGSTPNSAIRSPTGPPSAAPETAPAMMPMRVIPICTGGQEFARLGGQRNRHLRARTSALGSHLQPRGSRRDDRQLGHGEHPVQQDEREDRGEVMPGEGVHQARHASRSHPRREAVASTRSALLSQYEASMRQV